MFDLSTFSPYFIILSESPKSTITPYMYLRNPPFFCATQKVPQTEAVDAFLIQSNAYKLQPTFNKRVASTQLRTTSVITHFDQPYQLVCLSFCGCHSQSKLPNMSARETQYSCYVAKTDTPWASRSRLPGSPLLWHRLSLSPGA